ncbi:MAG: lipopolysaccharide biosynthesis protein [Granulosicoccus sp.]
MTDRSGREKSIGKDLFLSAATPALRLAAAFLQFAATVWIARLLGESAAGDFFFWSGVLMYVGQVASIGLDGLALQQTPRLRDRPNALGRFLGQNRTLIVIFAMVIGTVLIGYAKFLQPDTARPLLWYLALPLCTAGVALSRINGEAMKGLGHPLLGIVYRQLLIGAFFIVALVVYGKQLTANNALIIFALAFLLSGLAPIVGPGFRGLAPQFCRTTWEHSRPCLRDATPLFVFTVLVALSYVVPLVMLERNHPPEAISFFTTTFRIFMLVDLLGLAVHSVLLPGLSRAGNRLDWRSVSKIYQQATLNGLLLMSIPILVVFFAAVPIMSLFGDEFTAAAPLLRVMLVFAALSLLLGPANELILMINHTYMRAVLAAASLLLTLILSLLYIPEYGSIAVAYVIGCGMIFQKLLCIAHYARHTWMSSKN